MNRNKLNKRTCNSVSTALTHSSLKTGSSIHRTLTLGTGVPVTRVSIVPRDTGAAVFSLSVVHTLQTVAGVVTVTVSVTLTERTREVVPVTDRTREVGRRG